MNVVVDEINTQAREIASTYEASLEPFGPAFDKLLGRHAAEFDRCRLDEVVVAAIAPVVRILVVSVENGSSLTLCPQVRRMLAQWDPLQDPTAFTTQFRAWRQLGVRLGLHIGP